MIACLTVPYFAAAVERRDDRGLARRSLIIGGEPWEPLPLYAFSLEGARHGVRPGMSPRAAYLLSPASRFLPPATPRYAGAAGEIVDVLADFTHLIEPESAWDGRARTLFTASEQVLPARYYLDLEALPLREALPLAQEVGRGVRRLTALPPAIGLAPHKFTARVAATLARPHHALPVPADDEAAFLSSRSLGFLPLERETRRRLRLLGVHTLGQLAGIPLGALREQFGAEIILWHRLAQGQDDSPVTPDPPPTHLEIGHRFPEPVADATRLTALLHHLAGRLARRLAATDQVGQALRLAWETADGQAHVSTHPLRQPTASAVTLRQALDDWLAGASPAQGVTALTVGLLDLLPAAASQLSLLNAPPPPLPALDRLIARHGAKAFWRASLPEPNHPLPERRFALEPLGPPAR